MPCDNNAVDSLHVYVDVLTQISTVCDKYCAEYICIGGDMNTDLTRLHSHNTIALNRFVVTEGLNFALNHSTSNVSHTYNSFSVGTISNIDHFIVTDSIFQCISSYYTCDEIDNQSDHLPLFVTIDIKVKCAEPVINPTSNVRLPRLQWDRASIIECTQ